MANEGIFCSGCGITLRPFMQVCPRCEKVQEGATPLTPPSISSGESSWPDPAFVSRPAPQTPPGRSSKEAPRRGRKPNLPPPGSPMDIVFLSPNETGRRFPLLTDAQWKLVAIGIGLLILLLVLIYLV